MTGETAYCYIVVSRLQRTAVVAVLALLHGAMTTWIGNVGTDIKNIANATF